MFGLLRIWVGFVAPDTQFWIFRSNALDAIIINMTWTTYNLIVIGATLAVAREARQRRGTSRVDVHLPGMVRMPTGHTAVCETRDLSRGGALLSVEGDRQLEPGDPLFISLFLGDEEIPIPAHLVESWGGDLRVRFDEMSVDQEAGLIRALYSRADAWYGWNETIKRDRPLLSWSRVFRHALTGLPRLLAGRTRSET